MAKSIKSIKCPQCGSTSKTEIGQFHYKCSNCETEYYLDNDDINITITNKNISEPSINTTSAKKMVIAAVVMIVLLIIIPTFLLPLLSHKDTDIVDPVTNEEVPQYDTMAEDVAYFYSETKQLPILIKSENRIYEDDKHKDKNGFYFSFYDMTTKKLLNEQRFDNVDCRTNEKSNFSNGDMYIIVCNYSIYKVDKDLLKVTDVRSTIAKALPQLSSGIARISFKFQAGDGFNIVTNDGKELSYYPEVNKVYTYDEYWPASKGFKSLLPEAKDKNYFVFTEPSYRKKDQITQLIKMVYKDNGGGPKDLYGFPRWETLFPLQNSTKDDYRLVSVKDLTPERKYFDPEVLYMNDDYVIIIYKADANPKSSYTLQCLDGETGDLKWTIVEPNISKSTGFTECSKGYIYQTDSPETYKFIDFNGKMILQVTLEEITNQ